MSEIGHPQDFPEGQGGKRLESHPEPCEGPRSLETLGCKVRKLRAGVSLRRTCRLGGTQVQERPG